jgi:hypothetical protein
MKTEDGIFILITVRILLPRHEDKSKKEQNKYNLRSVYLPFGTEVQYVM